MTNRMLIDASHPEETRVVVLKDGQLVDFDFESSTKRLLKGNIYLAKVTRVEPSLQAAFVDYGGNRHGFLAFSEIHPDYFQIPIADREALERAARDAADEAEAEADSSAKRANGAGAHGANGAGDAAEGGEALQVSTDAEEETEEVFDEQARRRARLLRSYKIQEVIKRRQIMLVQVVKEERGSKGAALTTYLSLAGRYGVLMPNTPRGGGISRKIGTGPDRRRLKSLLAELKVPEGMGLIVRTAGAERSKAEIRRDYEYLLRLWNDIRERTLQSVAPCLIYEEANLIKRAMRDLYSRDVDEVLVEGEEGYRVARKFMGMLTPSHARRVRLYKEELPLFFRHKVEDQLDAMYTPSVPLRSGGSIVMHATEALIAIDVNSGRSTRERHIDETALKTNLEAADEIARQLRLRDLAGLVVIDFIDMAENRHQRQVERRLREALKADRARIQVGRISVFGLLELSRQRLRPSLQELSSGTCPTCSGAGVIRSTESSALQVLRAIEEEGLRGRAAAFELALPTEVALYLLNNKRDSVVRLEQRYAMRVTVLIDPQLHAPHFELKVTESRAEGPAAPVEPVPAEAAPIEDEVEAAAEEPAEQPAREGAAREESAREEAAADDGAGKKRRRRRRRRRKSDEAETPLQAADGEAEEAEDAAVEPVEADPAPAEPASVAPEHVDPAAAPQPEVAPEAFAVDAEAEAERKRRRRRRRTPKAEAAHAAQPAETAAASDPVAGETAEQPVAEEPVTDEPAAEPMPAGVVQGEGGQPPRQGWWSRWVRRDS